MKLLIVIPALNEEDSIESIILRTHAAKEHIIKNGGVSEVAVVVVSDGSTDKTVEIAQKHLDKIKLIIFEKNKGYGAAIKAGWESQEADLVSFLDADGTCDPLFFADLCGIIIKNNADIALGNRLNSNSKMPLVRRIGNTMFSILLSFVSAKRVKDTASGMRVIRKTALKRIMPLPDGLHFTPAMSARAILSSNLTIIEKDMPYHEREGESKLKIWKDGKRFLAVILENIFLYIPYRIYSMIGIFLLLVSFFVVFEPLKYYLAKHRIEDFEIYRIIISTIGTIIGILFLCIANLAHNIVHFTLQPEVERKKNLLYFLFEHWFSLVLAVILYIIGTALVFNSVWTRITTGLTYEHWSRYIALLFFYITGTIQVLSYFTNKILGLIKDRLIYLQS